METFKPATLTTLALSGATLCFAFAAIPPITGIGFAEKASAQQVPPTPPKPKPKPCVGAEKDKDATCKTGWHGGALEGNPPSPITDEKKLRAFADGVVAWYCSLEGKPEKITHKSEAGTEERGKMEDNVPCPAPTAAQKIYWTDVSGKGKTPQWKPLSEKEMKNFSCGTHSKYVPPENGKPCIYGE